MIVSYVFWQYLKDYPDSNEYGLEVLKGNDSSAGAGSLEEGDLHIHDNPTAIHTISAVEVHCLHCTVYCACIRKCGDGEAELGCRNGCNGEKNQVITTHQRDGWKDPDKIYSVEAVEMYFGGC